MTPAGESSISYRDIHLLNQIGQEFSSTLDFDSVIDTVMSRVKEVLQCEAGSVILFDEARDSLVFYAASGLGASEVKGLAIPKGKGVAGWVFEHKEPVIVNEAETDERFYPEIDKATHIKTRSVLCVPLKRKNKMLGVIEGINKSSGRFSDTDLDLLIAISQLAGISIENSMIHQKLAQKSENLARLNKEMEEFVNIVSHDLQTPLASIDGYVRLIRTEMGELLDKSRSLSDYVGRIEENTKNAFHFIKHLLSLIKLKDSSVFVQEFDPSGVFDEIAVVLEDEIRNRGATVLNRIEIKRILYDRSIFYHMLLNLVQNSLKYAFPGRKPVIEVGAKEHDNELHFFVKDNGKGMPEDEVERLFGRSERGNNSQTYDGHGFGLAFVKKAAEIFEGKVWVKSEADQGSTIYFSVPLVLS
jgi:signal transduction histidine kinase